MKFSRLFALPVAIGACAALACGSGDGSPTSSQGGGEGSESPATSPTKGESSSDAGAANESVGAATPGPTATGTSTSAPPGSAPLIPTSETAGDAGAAGASPAATSTSASPPSSPATSEKSAADAGAAENGTGASSSPSSTDAGPPIYFESDVYPILLANCGMTCHANGDATNGNFTLGTSFPVFNVLEELTTTTANHAAPDTACDEAYVINANAAGSLLYQKISGIGIPTGCGVQMPKGGPYLSAADQETIKNWIQYNNELLTR